MIEKLETQIENIPRLKKMVKEMDRLLDGGQSSKSVNESTGRSLKEDYSHSNVKRNIASLITKKVSYSHEKRKNSQPVLGLHGRESRSNEKDRSKESTEPIRIIDASL